MCEYKSLPSTSTGARNGCGADSIPFEQGMDAYGFVVRPQHLQRYRKYSNIYKAQTTPLDNDLMTTLESTSSPSPAKATRSKKGKEKVVGASEEKYLFVDDFPCVISRVFAPGRELLKVLIRLRSSAPLDHYASMDYADVMEEAFTAQWQGIQASLCAWTLLSTYPEQMEALEKKASDASSEITRLNGEIEKSRNAEKVAKDKVAEVLTLNEKITEQVKNLEENLVTLRTDVEKNKAQHDKDLHEAKIYWSWLSRVEVYEEYAAGNYKG